MSRWWTITPITPPKWPPRWTTVRRMFPRRRLWCVFQPHQASRTARLLDELAASLQNADRVVVAEIFRAREGPSPSWGGDGRRPGPPASGPAASRCCDMPHRRRNRPALLQTHLHAGDVLVTMGAGDIGRMALWLSGAVLRRSCGRLSRWRCTPGSNWAARPNSSPSRKTPTS